MVTVQVLSCEGSGSGAGVIAGIEWAVRDAQQHPAVKSVISMSLGSGYSRASNRAVDAAHDAGLTVVVAAGNDGADACGYSPASADKAISVGSTTSQDSVSSFSNVGTCAPALPRTRETERDVYVHAPVRTQLPLAFPPLALSALCPRPTRLLSTSPSPLSYPVALPSPLLPRHSPLAYPATLPSPTLPLSPLLPRRSPLSYPAALPPCCAQAWTSSRRARASKLHGPHRPPRPTPSPAPPWRAHTSQAPPR